MFRIKICGITNVEDAVAAVDAGADAIGLNFYEKSPRAVDVATARNITDTARDRVIDIVEGDLRTDWGIYPIGVLVNHDAGFIRHVFKEVRLVAAQLHGDEPAHMIGQLPDTPVIRVSGLGDGGCEEVAADLAACRESASNLRVVSPFAVLLDAMAAGQYGGTGTTLPWSELADHSRWLGDTPLILAGGLTPDNVAEAIRIVRPHAVDVASGVESTPGKKDPHKVRDFVAAAKAAFGL